MKSLLKFITCGSVDDGKSTLIGHMLYDAKLLYADQERALELDSKVGSREGKIDFSLLLDGLAAEREQGITIDVAYRYFTTDRRSFIVADTPGHEEYTRNMAVGASYANLAVILVDSSQGVLVQTKRHTKICSLMGIKHFVFAVNKMDLIEYNDETFQEIEKEIKKLMSEYEYDSLKIIPVSATEGDNVTNESKIMTWYHGGSLLNYLETVDVSNEENETGFTMPIQRVSRPNHTFRGFQGQIETGSVSVGDEVRILPSNEKAKVKQILLAGAESDSALKGQPVSIQLDREVDVSRGCVMVNDANLHISNMFTAKILWMDDNTLLEGKNYILKLGTQSVPAVVMNIKYQIDINSGEQIPAGTVCKNEIAVCDISTSQKIVFDDFDHNKALGELILIDRVTNMTSACGVVLHELRRGNNIVKHEMTITPKDRAQQKGQKPLTLWFTGLSGSGKSTIANLIEQRLFADGKHTMILDGDNVRLGLNQNLGFSKKDRIENIRRVAEVSKLMNDAALITLVSFISPFEEDRNRAREIIGTEKFIEIYVSTPIEVCEQRDVKGLYKKARKGEIPNFTGISSEYEVPQNPEITIDTSKHSLDECVDSIMSELQKYL